MATENTNITPAQQQKAERSLMLSVLVIIAAVAALAIVGFCFMNKPADLVEGQVEGTTVRISGKLPGRVVEFFAHEGDTVHAGDTLCAYTPPCSRPSSHRLSPCRTWHASRTEKSTAAHANR